MDQLPQGDPTIRKARSDCECAARPCLLDRGIARGEVHVAVHDNAPSKDFAGRVRTDLRHRHWSTRYHVVCFEDSWTTDRRTSMLEYRLEDLPGFERYRDDVERLRAERQK